MILDNSTWSVKDKYVLITGATSGIGLAAVKELASRGANIGIVARNLNKANKVLEELKQSFGNNVDVFLADMSSQQSIRKAAAEILAKCTKIDILINNAGALFEKRQLTEDGIEMTWAVNYLAPFLLTSLLIERMKENEHARIITTASHGHKMAKTGIVFEDISAKKLYQSPKKFFGGPTLRYGETKLANILFTLELAKKLKGSNVSSYCFDPGLVATNFNQNNGWLARSTMAVMKMFSRTPEKGAETLVWLADSDEVTDHSGLYYADMEVATPSVQAQNIESAKKLWEISENQVQHSQKLIS